MQGFYKRLQSPSVLSLALVSLLVLAYFYTKYYVQISLNASFSVKVFSFPLVSILIALIIPFFETSDSVNTKIHSLAILRELVIWISALSYSLYLVHLTMFDLVKGIFPAKTQFIITLPIALALAFFCSYLLYTYIETPFMHLRKNISDKKIDAQ